MSVNEGADPMSKVNVTLASCYRDYYYISLDLLSQRVVFGVSLRWFNGGFHLILCFGPFELGMGLRWSHEAPTPEPPDAEQQEPIQ